MLGVLTIFCFAEDVEVFLAAPSFEGTERFESLKHVAHFSKTQSAHVSIRRCKTGLQTGRT